MARFLRHINAPRWYTNGRHLKWLPAGEIQGNALRDLACTDNKISLYGIGDDTDLRDTVAALAASMNPAPFSYALIDENRLMGFSLAPKRGTTIDDSVNSRHVDLVSLTAADVLRLARVIVDSDRDTTDKADVITYVTSNFASGKFTRRPENANWDQFLEGIPPVSRHRGDSEMHPFSSTLSSIRSVRDRLVSVLMRI